MKIIRFIGEDEFEQLLEPEEVVEPIWDNSTGGSTLKTNEVVFFFSIENAEEDKKDANWLGQSIDVFKDTILFYREQALGVVSEDYVVVSDTRWFDDYRIGIGKYGRLSYFDGDGFVINPIFIEEVGVPSYSLDQVEEIYEIEEDDFKRIYYKG